jgi:hypothetical protein
MPYKVFLAIDTLGGLTGLKASRLFGFANNCKTCNTFLVMGVFSLIALLLSRLNEVPEQLQLLVS